VRTSKHNGHQTFENELILELSTCNHSFQKTFTLCFGTNRTVKRHWGYQYVRDCCTTERPRGCWRWVYGNTMITLEPV